VSDHGSHKKVSNTLVALSSAAVLAVYTAGYLRTKSAADRFVLQAETRRPVIPAPAVTGPTTSPSGPPAPVAISPPGERSITPVQGPSESTPPTGKARRPSRVATQKVPSTPSSAIPALTPPTAPELLPPAVVDQAAATPVPAVPEPPKPQYKDGTYFGWGTSRHGDIQAQVVIEGGRIASATIAQCLTRYSCSVIARLPPQVAERQSPETDYVSGATQSTNAFYYAVVEALSKAK
jgi:uncharacterized protein with FMN-binding domain